MKSEKMLIEDCRYFNTETVSVLFRNDNGMGYRKDGTPFRYGLQPGSGDIVGWKEITITADLVGKKLAVFQSIEIKTLSDKIGYQQIIFYLNVLIAGGLSSVYTEDRFLSHTEIMNLPRRYEKPANKAKYEKIISNLSKILNYHNR